MRADRLLSLLRLLQIRGRMTAQQLAVELDVSERTVYRDIEALCMAGAPVYADHGPHGGFSLLEDYRTSLNNLTEDEIRILFMLTVPAPLSQLGLSETTRSALLKLVTLLPGVQQRDEHQVRQRLHLDSSAWDYDTEHVPHLNTVYRAIWEDRVIAVTIRSLFNNALERMVEPYALVAKVNTWHLVCRQGDIMRVIRLGNLLDVTLHDAHFERDPYFDLPLFWEKWRRSSEANRGAYPVRLRVAPELMPHLPLILGTSLGRIRDDIGNPDDQGWYTLDITFESFAVARSTVLGFGRAVEVLEPDALRQSVIDFARQIVQFYDER